MNGQDIPPRDEEDPRERDLSQRSAGPAVNPWLVVALIVLAGAVVYTVSALL
jgi:glutamine synthetase